MCKTRKRNGLITVPYHLAPSYLQHNPYIKEGYRANLTPADCFRSIFYWTNETLNIWSHLLGFIVFLSLLIYDVLVVYHAYPSTGTDVIVASLVLICFMRELDEIVYPWAPANNMCLNGEKFEHHRIGKKPRCTEICIQKPRR
ncbi:unnamed protein product [Meganyctiphanes norvegica]|uniref:Progestin and adipoQ receptor family member 3 n=1 Tax=Meganyctiphanes norvegica TaxID=48144 RepID=A0AAV2RQT0_MEGNR